MQRVVDFVFERFDIDGVSMQSADQGRCKCSRCDSMSDAVQQIYRPRRARAQAALVQLFLDAEEAYFRHLPPDLCSTISLEPLVSSRPGLPVYLRNRLNEEQRNAYCQDIERLSRELEHLRGQFAEQRRLDFAGKCLQNVLRDARG